MKMRVENFLLFFLVTTFLICINSFSFGASARGVTNDTLKIGIILDQTGPAANVSVPLTNAIKRYFRYINEQGGINGRKIKIIVEDDRYSIPMAIGAFKKLLFRDKILAMVGPTSSGSTITLLRHIKKEKIPTMAIPPNEKTVLPLKRYVFGVFEVYPNTIKTIIDYMIQDLKPKNPRVAIVYPDNETGKLDLVPAIARLKHYKLKPLTKEVLNPGAIDAAPQVMVMRRSKINNIVLCGFLPQPAGVLLRELKKFNVPASVFGNTAASSEEVMHMAKKAAKKYYAVSPFASWYDNEEGVEFMRKVTLKYAPGTEKPYRGKLYTFGWAIATVLKEGISRSGKKIDGERLVTSVESIKDFDMKGISGLINFSSTNHKGMNSAKVYKAEPESGKFIPVTGWKVTK
ncbi:MAG: ABC transporter substrate-binding protein [Spirochaetota bacterium]|nr:ABC transporter substrate-binding protein [Spirochaetota bacterium]